MIPNTSLHNPSLFYGQVDIDWSNPITRGLVFAAYPLGFALYDAVSKEFSVTGFDIFDPAQATNNGFWDQPYAAAGRMDVNTNNVYWNANPVVRGASMNAEATLLCLGGCASQADGFLRYLMGNYDPIVTGDGFFLGIDNYNTVGNGNIFKAHGTGAIYGYTPTEVLGTSFSNKIHFFGFSCRNNGTDGTWFYKRTGETFTGKPAHGTTAANRRAYMFGISPSGIRRELMCLGLMWDRELRLEEYQSLYDNPWQLFFAGLFPFIFDAKSADVAPPSGGTGSMWHVFV